MLISCYTVLGDAGNAGRVARIALARAEKVVAQDRSNGFAMEVGVSALAALGETERAKDWMEPALLIESGNLQMRTNFACALAALLGDREAALDLLGSVLERCGDFLLEAIARDPDLAGLRGDPRFQTMVAAAKMRLAVSNLATGAEAAESA